MNFEEIALNIELENYYPLELDVANIINEYCPELMEKIVEALNDNRIEKSVVEDYFCKNPMNDTDRYNICEQLIIWEKEINPSISDSEALEKISKCRD